MTGQYQVAFSNVIRDFRDEELDLILANLQKLLADGAELYFSSPTGFFKENLYFYPKICSEPNEKKRTLLERLNRGRSNFCYQQINISEWEKVLIKHGFKVDKVAYFGSERFTEFWDTGLRGFTGFFAKAISDKSIFADKISLKNTMNEYWLPILNDILEYDMVAQKHSFQMIKAVLRK